VQNRNAVFPLLESSKTFKKFEWPEKKTCRKSANFRQVSKPEVQYYTSGKFEDFQEV
jgi:hypothetical protein